MGKSRKIYFVKKPDSMTDFKDYSDTQEPETSGNRNKIIYGCAAVIFLIGCAHYAQGSISSDRDNFLMKKQSSVDLGDKCSRIEKKCRERGLPLEDLHKCDVESHWWLGCPVHNPEPRRPTTCDWPLAERWCEQNTRDWRDLSWCKSFFEEFTCYNKKTKLCDANVIDPWCNYLYGPDDKYSISCRKLMNRLMC